jgi:hypothetical protein
LLSGRATADLDGADQDFAVCPVASKTHSEHNRKFRRFFALPAGSAARKVDLEDSAIFGGSAIGSFMLYFFQVRVLGTGRIFHPRQG